jgi:hypothetical protein
MTLTSRASGAPHNNHDRERPLSDAPSTNPADPVMQVIIGPSIGGLLALPAVAYPTLFDPDGFWARYPYLLPNLAAAAIAAVGFVVCYFGVPDSGPAAMSVQQMGPQEGEEDGGEGEGEDAGLLADSSGVRRRNARSGKQAVERVSPLVFCVQRKPCLSITFYSTILVFAMTDQASHGRQSHLCPHPPPSVFYGELLIKYYTGGVKMTPPRRAEPGGLPPVGGRAPGGRRPGPGRRRDRPGPGRLRLHADRLQPRRLQPDGQSFVRPSLFCKDNHE